MKSWARLPRNRTDCTATIGTRSDSWTEHPTEDFARSVERPWPRADGQDLEAVLDGWRPDLVVLDVMLPGRDGFALIDVIREWGDAKSGRPTTPRVIAASVGVKIEQLIPITPCRNEVL